MHNKGVISSEQVYVPIEQSLKLYYSPYSEMISFKKEVSFTHVLDILFKRG